MKKIQNFSLFVFLFISFYFRTTIYSIPSLLLAVVFFSLNLIDNNLINFKLLKIRYVKLDPLYVIFALLILIGFFYNLILYAGYYKYTILFFIEILFNMFIFGFIYVLLNKKFEYFNKITRYLVIGSLVYPVPAIIGLAMKLESIRRIGGADAEIITAVNHMGHSLSIALSICFVKYIFEKRKKYIFVFIPILIACFFTGSRAAILSAIINIVIILSVNKNRRVNITFIIIIFVMFFIFYSSGKYNSLIYRLSKDMLLRAFDNRLLAFQNALNNFNIEKDIFMGTGWYKYELLNATKNFISYPHNIILEIFIMFGFLSSTVFLIILFKEWIFILKRVIFKKQFLLKEATILICALNSVIIYSFTSGRLTRIITIFCILGMSSAFRNLIVKEFKENKNEKIGIVY